MTNIIIFNNIEKIKSFYQGCNKLLKGITLDKRR